MWLILTIPFIHRFKAHKGFMLISLLFFIIYSLISFVNHYCFRTYALDLGLYTNALYDYAHFRFNDSTVFKPYPENLLADHFDLFLVLISPLYYLFGQYTLLIIQLLFIHIGAAGVYACALRQLKEKRLGNMVTAVFLSFYGVFSAVSYDFHSNVIAAMLLPWFFYYFIQQSWWKSFLLLSVMLITKENVALWTGFICLGLSIRFLHETTTRKIALFFAALSFIYFMLVVQWLMPRLSVSGVYAHRDYHYFGAGFGEIFINLLRDPPEAFKTLFVNHLGDPRYDYYKTETHVFILLSGGFFLLLRPQYLLMLVPVYLQKMYHDNPTMWTAGRQYNIEFIPIITMAAIEVLKECKTAKRKYILSSVFLALTLATTIRLCDKTICYVDHNSIRIYQEGHYESYYKVPKLQQLMNSIPPHAVVSAQSMFVPHLACRDKIYQFPLIMDASYVLVSIRKNFYPLEREEFLKKLNELQSDPEWELISEDEAVFLFRNNSVR